MLRPHFRIEAFRSQSLRILPPIPEGVEGERSLAHVDGPGMDCEPTAIGAVGRWLKQG